MKKNIFMLGVFFTISVMIFFTSCNKENLKISSSVVPDFLQEIIDAHACLESDYNGNLVIQSYKTLHTQEVVSAKITGQFYGTEDLEDKGSLKIGNSINISANDQNRYDSQVSLSDLYGHTNSITLEDGNSTYFSKDFTLPKMVKVTYPSIHDNFVIEQGANSITWEVDNNNSVGVAIVIEYFPEFPDNQTFVDQGHDKTILNTKILPDNGSYNFEASDFADIPHGAIIAARIIRVGCNNVIDNETGGKYFVYGYSMVDTFGKYMGGLN